jgi:ParB-like nuclease domain
MPPQERQELKESIQQHGQLYPVVVSEGKVVDGRHRYEICLELGIEPRTIDFSEQQKAAGVKLTVEEFIFDSNMKRRHLTTSQRAAIAAEFANMRQGERTDLTPSDSCPKVSQEKAGELLKVSSKSVRRAKQVKEKDPTAFDKVKAGDISLNAAVESLGPKPEVDESPVPDMPPGRKKKKQKPPTRGERLVNAGQDLIDAIGKLRSAWEEHIGPVNEALEELQGVQEEYESWRDSLPENLQSSATAEMLTAICDIQLKEIEEPDFETLESAAEECLEAEIPRGFGRD